MVKKCKVREAEAVYCLEEEKRSGWWYNWDSELSSSSVSEGLKADKTENIKMWKRSHR